MRKKISKKILFTIFFSFNILGFISFPIHGVSELSLTVSSQIRCKEPSVFTVDASGGTGEYMYYLGNITRVGEDGTYFVVDPSRLPGYRKENTFEFTFFASGIYYLHFYVMDKGVKPVVTKRKIITVNIQDPDYPSVEAVADMIAAQCRSLCRTDYDRALWLHDWLLDHCTYDYSYLYCGSEGALVRGTGTCESYHRAYTMLLNRVGIANGRMEGNGHVWTAARIDGNWCQIDVTWDDNGYSHHTYENYLYFGLDDSIMKMVHSDHNSHPGYESTTLTNHYLIRSGKIHQWSDPLEKQIRKELEAKKTKFMISIDSGLPAGYKDVLYNLAAYQLSSQNWSDERESIQVRASYSEDRMEVIASYKPISSTEESTLKDPEKESSEEIRNSLPEINSKPSESSNPEDSKADTSSRNDSEERKPEIQESSKTEQDSRIPQENSQQVNSIGFESEWVGSKDSNTENYSEAIPSHPTENIEKESSEINSAGNDKGIGEKDILIYVGGGMLILCFAVMSGFVLWKRKMNN